MKSNEIEKGVIGTIVIGTLIGMGIIGLMFSIVLYIAISIGGSKTNNQQEDVKSDGMQGKWGQIDTETGIVWKDFYFQFDGEGNVNLYTSSGKPSPRVYTISDKIYIKYTDGTEYMTCTKKSSKHLICTNKYGITGWEKFSAY